GPHRLCKLRYPPSSLTPRLLDWSLRAAHAWRRLSPPPVHLREAAVPLLGGASPSIDCARPSLLCSGAVRRGRPGGRHRFHEWRDRLTSHLSFVPISYSPRNHIATMEPGINYRSGGSINCRPVCRYRGVALRNNKSPRQVKRTAKIQGSRTLRQGRC